MSEVNKKRLKEYLTLYKIYKTGDDLLDTTMNSLFSSAWFEGELYTHFGTLNDMFLMLLTETTNVNREELDWFIYECDMGDDPKECKLEDGTEILIDSIDTFLQTI